MRSSKRALWRSLPAVHPRELPGSAGSAITLWQGVQNISLDDNTMRSRTFHRKRKAGPACEETVDAREWLWKALENMERTAASCADRRSGRVLGAGHAAENGPCVKPLSLDNAVELSAARRARGE